jgi:hypothetical protein
MSDLLKHPREGQAKIGTMEHPEPPSIQLLRLQIEAQAARLARKITRGAEDAGRQGGLPHQSGEAAPCQQPTSD